MGCLHVRGCADCWMRDEGGGIFLGEEEEEEEEYRYVMW